MYNYIAIIHKEADSDYGVSFPDLPGVISAGETMEEAIKQANEALNFHIEGLIEDGEKIPHPSSLENIERDIEYKDSEQALIIITVDVQKSVKYKRINISLPEDVIDQADKYAKASHTTRSGFINNLIKTYSAPDNRII
jgi:predicted RNase H-like HicB family nuclease